MRIKKFVADSMPEALKLVRDDLGPRAVILNTRTTGKGGLLGKKGQVEVTAAVDDARPAPEPEAKALEPAQAAAATPRGTAPQRKTDPLLSASGRESQEARPAVLRAATSPQAPAAVPDGKWAARLSQQMEELELAVRAGARPSTALLPGALGPLSRQMEEDELSPDIARDILERILLDPGPAGLKDADAVLKRAARMVAEKMPPPRPLRLAAKVRTVLALVGPSGAGKTTAAARIAAHVCVGQKARVALITADTDRVGGLEQIKAFAGILDLPLDAAYTPEDMRQAIAARRDAHLVIIDSGGASPLAREQLSGLGAILREAAPSEIHLVLNATTGLRQMRDAFKAFATVGVDRLLFTHLDETARFGGPCSLSAESGTPMSFVTSSRAVPGGLADADRDVLAAALFKRSL